ncbi:MAG TPA: hypothetical protein VH000_04225 [Rhizomicrobium sp.]|nr:hypothetical protein [Rhizomicrobium sp.]
MTRKQTAYLLTLCFLLASVNAANAAAPPPPAGCKAPQSRQLDFWVGKWNIYPKATPDKQTATSVVESLYEGCAIRENWKPLAGSGGGSLSTYDANEKSWRQFWTDAYGGVAEFSGGWNGTSMVITGTWPMPQHPTQMTRMGYTPLPDGSVEQAGETSDDNGKTWQPGFDLIYRKVGE